MSQSTQRAPPRWYVISLRPRGGHAPLRTAAAARGAGLIALSPWRLQSRDDDATRSALDAALGCSRVVFTSPAAARAAAAMEPLAAHQDRLWCAVGAGTAAALRRAGVTGVYAPSRMDSEGLLSLDVLRDIAGASIGLVTAPGGRSMLLPALQVRGAQVLRADVYERVPVTPSAASIAALRTLQVPLVIALSSGEALQRTLATVPADAAAMLLGAQVVAASARLAELARTLGFARIAVARSPRPHDLLDAVSAAG